MADNQRISAGAETSGDELSRRSFLRVGGAVVGGLSLSCAAGALAEEPQAEAAKGQPGACQPVIRRTDTWIVHVPAPNPLVTRMKDGKICVYGLVTQVSMELEGIAAKVFYGQEPEDDETCPMDAQIGEFLEDPETWPPEGGGELAYNFHFTNDKTVPGGEDHSGGGGDDENWLLIWAKFNGNYGDPHKIRIKCRALSFNDCDPGTWWDTFTDTGVGTPPVVGHNGESTPGGYSGDSGHWKISSDRAVRVSGPNTTSAVKFDLGALTFTASHAVTVPGPGPANENWSMWVVRGFREYDSSNKWQWQIGAHQYDTDQFQFHELVEWVSGSTTQHDAANLTYDPGATVACEMCVDGDDDIWVSFGGSELKVTNDSNRDVSGQSFDAYYDVASNTLPTTKAKFDDLLVEECDTCDCPPPTLLRGEREALQAALLPPAELPDEALVLSQLARTTINGGSSSYRPRGFLHRDCRKTLWRWTDQVGAMPVYRPKPGGNPVTGLWTGLYLVRGKKLDDALNQVDSHPECVVLWRKIVDGADTTRDPLSRDAKRKVKALMGGYPVPSDGAASEVGDRAKAKLLEVHGRNRELHVKSTLPQRAAAYKSEIDSLKPQIPTLERQVKSDPRNAEFRRLLNDAYRKRKILQARHEAAKKALEPKP